MGLSLIIAILPFSNAGPAKTVSTVYNYRYKENFLTNGTLEVFSKTLFDFPQDIIVTCKIRNSIEKNASLSTWKFVIGSFINKLDVK